MSAFPNEFASIPTFVKAAIAQGHSLESIAGEVRRRWYLPAELVPRPDTVEQLIASAETAQNDLRTGSRGKGGWHEVSKKKKDDWPPNYMHDHDKQWMLPG